MQKQLTVYDQKHYDSERHKLWTNNGENTEDMLVSDDINNQHDTIYNDENYTYLDDNGDGYDYENVDENENYLDLPLIENLP